MGRRGLQGLPGAAGLRGPTGAAGASILDSYDTYQQLVDAHPTGTQGDAYLAGGELYVWSAETGQWEDMGSLIGPTGAAGASILDSYDTYQQLVDAHPTGTQGDAYLAGGELYVWSAETGQWEDMGSLIGPTGAAGASILDSYDTYQQLVDAHPTGTQGDAYLAGGELYVWSAETGQWEDMGSLIGPTGPTGENGADGLIGRIDGVVDTVSQLPAEGAEQGSMYYVEEDDGIYVWDEAAQEWVKISVAQGPRGITGPEGPQGPTGADGIMGPIKGVVASVEDLPAGGVQQGDLYYVEDDGLYVWDAVNGWVPLGLAQGPRGVAGPAGPAGPEASSYMIIPFASTEAPRTYSNNGNPSSVSLLGFGYGDKRDPLLDDYAITLDPSDYSFLLNTNNGHDNRQLVFSLPFDVSIRSIYITVGNYGAFSPDNAVFPYVQLFKAEAGSNNFTVLEDAFVVPETGIGPGTDIPADTMRSVGKTGLDIKLSAGTRIGIGGMMQIPGDTGEENYYLYFTGGIGLTFEPAN